MRKDAAVVIGMVGLLTSGLLIAAGETPPPWAYRLAAPARRRRCHPCRTTGRKDVCRAAAPRSR